jgi:hypothetical protein
VPRIKRQCENFDQIFRLVSHSIKFPHRCPTRSQYG